MGVPLLVTSRPEGIRKRLYSRDFVIMNPGTAIDFGQAGWCIAHFPLNKWVGVNMLSASLFDK